MKIRVKSTKENWIKEELGLKANTVRQLDGLDTIELEDTETGYVFSRKITDITIWRGNIIISWDSKEK